MVRYQPRLRFAQCSHSAGNWSWGKMLDKAGFHARISVDALVGVGMQLR